jgi:predicted secreted Zn-dependent protease
MLTMTPLALALLLQAVPPTLPTGERPPAALADLPNLTITFYAVSGADPQAVRRSMNERRPRDPLNGKPYDARTDVSWKWRAPPRADGRGCDPAAAVFTHAVTMTLPKLSEPARLKAAERADWERYMARLIAHERNHALIGIRGGAALEKSFKAAPDCKRGQEIAAAASSAMAAAHLQYDAKTQHGVLEGAVYPPGRAASARPGR